MRLILLLLVFAAALITTPDNANADDAPQRSGIWRDQPSMYNTSARWPTHLALLDQGVFLEVRGLPCDRGAPKPEPTAVARVGRWRADGETITLNYTHARVASPTCACTGGGEDPEVVMRMACWVEIGPSEVDDRPHEVSARVLADLTDREEIENLLRREGVARVARIEINGLTFYNVPDDAEQPRDRLTYLNKNPFLAQQASDELLAQLGCALNPEYLEALEKSKHKMRREPIEAVPVICESTVP